MLADHGKLSLAINQIHAIIFSKYFRGLITFLIIAIRCTASFTTQVEDNIWSLPKLLAAKEKAVVCSDSSIRLKKNVSTPECVLIASAKSRKTLTTTLYRLSSIQFSEIRKTWRTISSRAPPTLPA